MLMQLRDQKSQICFVDFPKFNDRRVRAFTPTTPATTLIINKHDTHFKPSTFAFGDYSFDLCVKLCWRDEEFAVDAPAKVVRERERDRIKVGLGSDGMRGFQKRPGKFFPLDIDYGVKKPVLKKHIDNDQSRLAPALVDLMKMLFNADTYSAAMMEFQINLAEMALGKLSASNIQKGFEALTQIQNFLANNDLSPAMKESLFVDASNRFFTLIPSIHPHVIKDEDEF
ncbi:hypothetical protein Droror1_Dr00017326 [Drosera rotundifolia]